MAKRVPDAGSYAPVTVVVDERPDGVHISFDRMASLHKISTVFSHSSGARKVNSISSSRTLELPNMRPSEILLRSSTIQFSTSTSGGTVHSSEGADKPRIAGAIATLAACSKQILKTVFVTVLKRSL